MNTLTVSCLTYVIVVLRLRSTSGQIYGTWSPWYDVDDPTGTGDYEDVVDIAKHHGHNVCGEDMPLSAECREVDSDITFFSNNLTQVRNRLENPCTITGLICRNEDQFGYVHPTCQDYEIRFLCPSSEENPTESSPPEKKNPVDTKYGMIILAGLLSIFIPIVFVIILQSIRDMRTRRANRNAARQLSVNASEENRYSDNPPSYVDIFGNASTSSTLNLVSNEILAPESYTNRSSSNSTNSIFHISSGNLNENSEIGIRSGNETFPTGRIDPLLPGMHLTIWDAYPQFEQNSNDSPPSYSEALVILGDMPPKY